MKCFLLYFLLISPLFFTGCLQTAGTNDETVIKSAKVYNPDLTAARNTDVKIFEVNDTTRIPVYATTTDESGRYNINVPDGMFNVMIGDGHLAAFQDSVTIGEEFSTLHDDTLATTAVLSGKVLLEPNHNPRTVFMQIVGTDKYANVGPDSAFIIAGLAKGEYTLRGVSTISEYTPTYTRFVMDPQEEDTTDITVSMIYTGIPVVRNLRLEYDTLLDKATLFWDTLSFFMLKEFVVYCGENLPIGSSDSCSYTINTIALNYNQATTITFFVAAKTKTLEIGPVFESVTVEVQKPVAINLPDTVRVYTGRPCTLQVPVVWYRDVSSVKYEWDIGETGVFTEGSGPDTILTLSGDRAGDQFKCKVRAIIDGRRTMIDSTVLVCNFSWEKIAPPFLSEQSIHQTVVWKGMLLDILSDQGIYRSDDGSTWAQLIPSVPFPQAHSNPVVFKDVLCTADSAGYLWASSDAIAWERSPAPLCSTWVKNGMAAGIPGYYAPALYASDETLYLQTDPVSYGDSVMITRDLETWSIVKNTINFFVAGHRADGDTVFLCGRTASMVFRTGMMDASTMEFQEIKDSVACVYDNTSCMYNKMFMPVRFHMSTGNTYCEYYRGFPFSGQEDLLWMYKNNRKIWQQVEFPQGVTNGHCSLVNFNDRLLVVSDAGVYKAIW